MAQEPNKVLSIIMGGGQGSRLFPLTRERSKPAVPLAGKYRLVDIPISNCINSGLRQIYLLTQFNSASLHRHLSMTYKMDHFSGGFVEILAAEQTPTDTSWYQGTADAVRKNLIHFLNHPFEYFLILSGDQLYTMDYHEILTQHIETKAEITIATIPVKKEAATSLGIMQIAPDKQISNFVEKPKDPAILETLKIPRESYETLGIKDVDDLYLASMGIYVFNRETLIQLLDNSLTDFGKHIIPSAIQERRVYSFVFQGYWEDVGTIRSYFEANLDQTSPLPKFNFFDMSMPTFTRPRFLPASKVNRAELEHTVLSEGCILDGCKITSSVIGIRSRIGDGSSIHNTVHLGCDYYESAASIAKNVAQNRPPIGIGRNTVIKNAIIDKNARIGSNCVITPENKPETEDHPLYYIRDGILIIPKNGIVPDNTTL